MNSSKIGIVIVNYNGAKYQNECVKSILNSTYENYKIIIVDNDSKDDSMDMLNVFSDERIVKIYAKQNLGVAAGNNLGIVKAFEFECDSILLLNNDTILNEDTIECMVEELDNNPIVSPKIYYWEDKNKFWYVGGKFNKIKGTSIHYYYKEKDCGQNIDDYCDYAPTCCLLIRKDVFYNVGFIDPIYFMYCDDTDFCMRAKIAGYKIKIAKKTSMYHKISLSTGGEGSKLSIYYMNRNRFYFVSKYKRQLSFLSYQFTYWSRKLKYFKSIFTKSNSKIINEAYKDYKHNRMGKCDKI